MFDNFVGNFQFPCGCHQHVDGFAFQVFPSPIFGEVGYAILCHVPSQVGVLANQTRTRLKLQQHTIRITEDIHRLPFR